ncbi:MAG: TetR/AcrR family transcriptional regulator [Candidatus Hydrothermia bacterium]
MEQNTKEKILKAGERLFSNKGYDATSVAEICEEAGVSKGAFFHYFDSKESFFLELLNRWLTELNERIQEYVNQESDVANSVLRMSELFKDIFRESRQKFLLFMEFLRIAIRDERVLKELANYFQNYTNYFSELIDEGIKNGTFKDIEPEIAARTIIAYAIGIIEQEIFEPEKNWEYIGRRGIELILNALRRR